MQRVNYSLAVQAPEYSLNAQSKPPTRERTREFGFILTSAITNLQRLKKTTQNKGNADYITKTITKAAQLEFFTWFQIITICFCYQVDVSLCVVVYQTNKRQICFKEKENQTDVQASKCRLWICSEVKMCSRRHSHTNRAYCVHTQKNTHRHKQFSQWYILTCAFPFCTIAARWPECVSLCVYCRWGLQLIQKAWESLGSCVSAK